MGSRFKNRGLGSKQTKEGVPKRALHKYSTPEGLMGLGPVP